MGRPYSVAYPDGYEVFYAYYPKTTLARSVVGSDLFGYADYLDFDAAGKIEDMRFGNNVTHTYTYDPQSRRLDGFITEDQNTNTFLQHRTYTYTPAGDIESIADGITGITYHYGYDALHRLTSETTSGNVPAVATTSHVMTFGGYGGTNPAHAVGTVNVDNGLTVADYDYEYDGNGNITVAWDMTDPATPSTRGTQVSPILYNADNMPVAIPHGTNGVTTILYDGDNVRAQKSTGADARFYFDKYYETTGGALSGGIKYIFAGDTRIAQVTGSGVNFFHTDHLKSATVVTGYVPSGPVPVVQQSDYLPFGSDRSHTGTATDYKFTDQEKDTSTGLYNYDARLYDPAIGMFNIPDTMLPDVYDPQQLNRYAYARNNPLIYVDPSGHYVAIMSRPLPSVWGKLGLRHSVYVINDTIKGYHAEGEGGIKVEDEESYNTPGVRIQIIDPTHGSDKAYEDFLNDPKTQEKYSDESYSKASNNCNDMVQEGLKKNGNDKIKVDDFTGLPDDTRGPKSFDELKSDMKGFEEILQEEISSLRAEKIQLEEQLKKQTEEQMQHQIIP